MNRVGVHGRKAGGKQETDLLKLFPPQALLLQGHMPGGDQSSVLECVLFQVRDKSWARCRSSPSQRTEPAGSLSLSGALCVTKAWPAVTSLVAGDGHLPGSLPCGPDGAEGPRSRVRPNPACCLFVQRQCRGAQPHRAFASCPRLCFLQQP